MSTGEKFSRIIMTNESLSMEAWHSSFQAHIPAITIDLFHDLWRLANLRQYSLYKWESIRDKLSGVTFEDETPSCVQAIAGSETQVMLLCICIAV